MTSVDASPVLITDATTGVGTFTVTVVFSEAMDLRVRPTPVLTFAQRGQHVDLNGGLGRREIRPIRLPMTWPTPTCIEASVTIDVTGAKDAADNDQVDYAPLSEFAIDTVNPTVTSVVASPILITDATTDAGTFTVTVVFSEAMDTSVRPRRVDLLTRRGPR